MILDLKFDNQGLIIQRDGDQGDTAARNGELYTGIHFNPEFNWIMAVPISFEESIVLLEPKKDGNLVRYNKFPYNDPFDKNGFATSRDQTEPNIVAAGFRKDKEFIKRVFLANVKNWFRYPNGDTMLLSLNIYIRAAFEAGYKWTAILYPLLFVLDLNLLANSSLITFLKSREPGPVRKFLADKLGLYFFVQDYSKSNNPTNPDAWSVHGKTNVGDDINHTQILLQSANTLATPTSWFARFIYKFRKYGVQYAFDYYHRPETHGNPLNELYRPIISKWFSK